MWTPQPAMQLFLLGFPIFLEYITNLFQVEGEFFANSRLQYLMFDELKNHCRNVGKSEK